MRKNMVNRSLAAGIAAFAMMLAVSPVTAQAAGVQVQAYQPGRNFSYITLTNHNQDAILKRLQALGVNQDCLDWAQDILNQICPEGPNVPGQPIIPEVPSQPEKPTEPSEPETPGIPEQPTEPEAPIVPETPSQPSAPEQPTTPSEPEIPETPSQSAFAARVIELVNKERAKEGLSPLVYDAAIENAAQVRAKEIQSSFSHTRPNGSSFSTAMKESGVAYRRAGENIAWGQKSPEEVVKGWMNSPSHRENIMNRNYGRIGVGHLKNAQGTSYWVQLFAD